MNFCSSSNRAFDFGPAHQQLHSDPGAEREAGDPAGARFRIDGLRPVERRRSVGKFAGAMIERALAAADTAEIEPHHAEAELLEALVHRVGDTVIHGTAMQRMRVHDQRERRTALLAVVVATLQAPIGAGEHHLRH